MSVTQSPPPDASGTARGLVNLVAQTFAGAKTFVATIIASAGIQVGLLFNTNGGTSGDRGVVVGFSTADGSVNANAKPLSAGTGIGGSYVEKFFVDKNGDVYTPVGGGFGRWFGSSGGASSFAPYSTLARITYSSANCDLDNSGWSLYLSSVALARWTLAGRFDQQGTDSSGSPGAATVAKPIGKNAIALGASSVVITNSLVTASSVILITPHARDATCKELIAVPAAGSFTVSGSANATAALPFSWEVKTLL
jgi:hypothetical protein